MDLTAKMMDNWDVLAEFNPPEALKEASTFFRGKRGEHLTVHDAGKGA